MTNTNYFNLGTSIWHNKTNKNLIATRSYSWCDRIIVTDESRGRLVVLDTKFSTFDFTDWYLVLDDQFLKELREQIIDGVYDQIGNLGLDDRKTLVSKWRDEEKVPLRIVLDKFCDPIVENVYNNVVSYLKGV